MKTMTVQEVLALHGHSLPTDGEEGTIYFGAGWTSETDCPHLQADAIAEPWGVSSDGGRTYRVTDPAGPQIRLAIFGRGAETYGSLSLWYDKDDLTIHGMGDGRVALSCSAYTHVYSDMGELVSDLSAIVTADVDDMREWEGDEPMMYDECRTSASGQFHLHGLGELRNWVNVYANVVGFSTIAAAGGDPDRLDMFGVRLLVRSAAEEILAALLLTKLTIPEYNDLACALSSYRA